MKKLNNRRFIFYYESVAIGGAQLLFARVAKNLYCKGFQVSYICSSEGYIRKELIGESGIEFIDLNEIENHHFSNDDLIIAPLSYINKLLNIGIKNRDVCIFLWDLHPYNYIEYTVFSFFYKKNSMLVSLLRYIESLHIVKLANSLRRLQEYNSVAFMCKKNFTLNADFFDILDIKAYLPICIELDSLSEQIKFKKKINKSEISLGWISRLDDDKVMLLNDFIRDLNNLEFDHSKAIKLFVIGHGSAISNIEKSTFVEIKLVGELSGKELENFILKNIDSGFSVGTSALEFAKFKTPTFLVPGNDARIRFMNNDRKYLPLSSVSDYDVAVESYHCNTAIALKDCLSLIYKDSDMLSAKCYKHVLENHSVDNTVSMLIKNLSHARYKLSFINEDFKSGFFLKFLKFFKYTVKKTKSLW